MINRSDFSPRECLGPRSGMTVWGLREFFTQVKIRDRDDSDSPEGCVGSGASLRARALWSRFLGNHRVMRVSLPRTSLQRLQGFFAKLAKTRPEFVQALDARNPYERHGPGSSVGTAAGQPCPASQRDLQTGCGLGHGASSGGRRVKRHDNESLWGQGLREKISGRVMRAEHPESWCRQAWQYL